MFKVLRGSRNFRDIGRVIEVDGQKQLKIWNGEKCNTILGTDALIFPPMQPANEPIYIYIRQLCHSLDLRFRRKGMYRGIYTHVFTNNFHYTGVDDDDDNRCFCRSNDIYDNICPRKGTIDLTPCLKVPLTGSLPHFYLADESLVKNIASGIQPDPKKHEFFLNMELVSFYRNFFIRIQRKKKIYFYLGVCDATDRSRSFSTKL